MDKMAKDKLVRSPRGENGGGQDAQKDLHTRTGRDEKNGKTQEKMERGSRKRCSSAVSEKMERVGGRQEKMEGHCSTGQSPQWAVVQMEEEISLLPKRDNYLSYPEPDKPKACPLNAFLILNITIACTVSCINGRLSS